MTPFQLYLSLSGRISRKTLWLKWLLPLYLTLAALGFLDNLTGGALLATSQGNHSSALDALGEMLWMIVIIALPWMSIAIQVKRWHDRDKSGWWMLLNAVPLLNLWALVELGFVEGTPGPNKYGEAADKSG